MFSVLLRVPNLSRPLSKHHEFLTAISLRILQIWENEGASQLKFLPRMNYEGKANKQINNHASTTGNMKDKSGNFYYVSHPPFAYLFAYGFHSLLQIKVSVLSLQVFNLLINFLSSLFIYLILLNFFEKKSLIPVIGFIIYIFNPAVLWFQSNTYMSDILVHFFFITTLFFFVRNKKEHYQIKSIHFLLLNFSLFLMCYTSWLGYFFAGVLVLYLIYKTKENKLNLIYVLLITLVSLIALLLTVYHYSQIAGLDIYLEQMKNRFAERGIRSGTGFVDSLSVLLVNYLTILLNAFINHGIIISLLIFSVFKYRKKTFNIFKSIPKHLLLLSFLPVLLLYLLLPDYCGHDFTSLYASLLFVILLSFISEQVFFDSEILRKNHFLVIGTYIIISSLWYYGENLPGSNSIKGKPYATGMELGKFIKERSNKELPVILISDEVLGPETVYYAERNIFEANDQDEAKNFLRLNKYSKGLLVITKTGSEIHHENIAVEN